MSDERTSNLEVALIRLRNPEDEPWIPLREAEAAALVGEIERLRRDKDEWEHQAIVARRELAALERRIAAIDGVPDEPTVVREDADRIVELERECANAKESRNAEMRLRQSAEAAASVVLAKYWTRLQAIVGDMDSELNGSSSTKDAVASAPRCESCGRNQSDGPAHWPTCTAAETNGAQ